MTDTALAERIEAVRRFSRFYTRHIGALEEGLLRTPFSLTEARVMYELGQRATTTATELGTELGLDAGYLSRILRGFHARGLLDRRPSQTDARQTRLSLTAAGRAAFAELDAASRHDIGAMLETLSIRDQEQLVNAMRTIESVLGTAPHAAAPFAVREARAEDMDWVVRRHRELYTEEYGWGETFAGLVADSAAAIGRELGTGRAAGWIAEVRGERAGCGFVTRESEEVAKLRLLLVDPAARGMGAGGRLVDECIRFAREAGCRRITLFTNEVLLAARRIYADRGFRVVHKERQDEIFGHAFVAETWELEL
jgi:DNA-binding MarR family transcriptional regulator/GNAT superfamily N-acetyltransferase